MAEHCSTLTVGGRWCTPALEEKWKTQGAQFLVYLSDKESLSLSQSMDPTAIREDTEMSALMKDTSGSYSPGVYALITSNEVLRYTIEQAGTSRMRRRVDIILSAFMRKRWYLDTNLPGMSYEVIVGERGANGCRKTNSCSLVAKKTRGLSLGALIRLRWPFSTGEQVVEIKSFSHTPHQAATAEQLQNSWEWPTACADVHITIPRTWATNPGGASLPGETRITLRSLKARSGPTRVYEAVVDGQVVALKTVNEEYYQNNVREMTMLWEQEFKVLKSVSKVADDLAEELGGHDRSPLMAFIRPEASLLGNYMQFVPGVSLDKLQTSTRFCVLPKTEACRVFRQMTLALHALHRAGIQHSDMKPSNIMYSTSRGAVLVDFGLAREMPKGQNHLYTRGGTCPYVSPEQMTDGGMTYPESDFWSLGVTMGFVDRVMPHLDTPGRAFNIGQVIRQLPSGKRTEDIRKYEDMEREIEDLIEKLRGNLSMYNADEPGLGSYQAVLGLLSAKKPEARRVAIKNLNQLLNKDCETPHPIDVTDRKLIKDGAQPWSWVNKYLSPASTQKMVNYEFPANHMGKIVEEESEVEERDSETFFEFDTDFHTDENDSDTTTEKGSEAATQVTQKVTTEAPVTIITEAATVVTPQAATEVAAEVALEVVTNVATPIVSERDLKVASELFSRAASQQTSTPFPDE